MQTQLHGTKKYIEKKEPRFSLSLFYFYLSSVDALFSLILSEKEIFIVFNDTCQAIKYRLSL